MKYQNVNDVVYAVAKRARELADKRMDELRLANGYGCNTPSEARAKDRYKSRGDIIEELLTEEFIEEFPQDLDQE